MKPPSGTVVLVLSVAFGGAAAFGVANSLATPPPAGVTQPVPSMPTAAPFVRLAAARQIYRNGNYVGSLENAFYGFVRVRVDIQGGRIVAIHVLRYPSDNPTSRYINSRALPVLRSEVIRAQNVFVYMISGATLSSNAFLRSTYAALRQAHA